MARRNHRTHKPQARRSSRVDAGLPPRSTAPRIPVDKVVIPDGRCDLNPSKPKAFYSTEAKAAKALAQAQQRRAQQGSGHVEKRYYLCVSWVVEDIRFHFLKEEEAVKRAAELGRTYTKIEHYHLTSREQYDGDAWKGGRS